MVIKDKNLYFVGGVVRDEILGIKSLDIDYTYEGDAIEFAKEKGLNIIKTNPDFGTVRVLTSTGEIDIASTRLEIYPKAGHLPVIQKIACSLEEDLKRRDFTINALAKNTLTGEIVDIFGGLDDIKNNKLKVLHEKSFIEDPSRILRGFKFAIRFGFELEKNTEILERDYLENINYDISYHRLKKELKEIFSLDKAGIFDEFINKSYYKLLNNIQKIPQVKLSDTKIIKNYNLKYPYMVYLSLFNLENFELLAQEAEIVNKYNEIKNNIPRSDIEIYRLFNNLPLETIILYGMTIDDNIAIRYLDYLSKIRIEINGNDLRQLGIAQGKIY
ncbi:CCA tRNA nucleotidyltransferase, partial [bacterium]|nr:CCA tRNA nucleotidyltransferase [bacterium]